MSYATDEEQVDAIKRWWRENGRSVIGGIVVALAAVIGWQQWGNHQEARSEQASAEYYAFLQELQEGEPGEGLIQRGEALMDRHGRTPYATLAAFWLAQHQAEQGEAQAAEEYLRWVVQNGDSDSLRHIARLRLGRLLLGADNHGAALEVLRTANEGAFASQYHELRGDIYSASGEHADAVRAYRSALADPELDRQRRSLIELKLVDMGAGTEPLS